MVLRPSQWWGMSDYAGLGRSPVTVCGQKSPSGVNGLRALRCGPAEPASRHVTAVRMFGSWISMDHPDLPKAQGFEQAPSSPAWRETTTHVGRTPTRVGEVWAAGRGIAMLAQRSGSCRGGPPNNHYLGFWHSCSRSAWPPHPYCPMPLPWTAFTHARRTEATEVPSSRAILPQLSPCCRRSTAKRRSNTALGLPIGLPDRVPVALARSRPARTLWLIRTRSCLARLAKRLITTSLKGPALSIHGSVKLRQSTP